MFFGVFGVGKNGVLFKMGFNMLVKCWPPLLRL